MAAPGPTGVAGFYGPAHFDYINQEIAYSGAQGSQFRPETMAAAATLVANATQPFRDALRKLAMVGCGEAVDLYDVAITYAHLFYTDVSCTRVPVEYVVRPTPRVTNFDPAQTPPDTFEQQFGMAYYE